MNTFLADPSLAPLWRRAAEALDHNGLGWRGRLSLPSLSDEGRRRLGILLDRTIGPDRRAVKLSDLADGVAELSPGQSFPEILAELGHRPKGRREAAQERRAVSRERRGALDAVVDELAPGAAWLPRWAAAAHRDGLIGGLSAAEVGIAVRQVVAVTEHGGRGRSRTEVAALLLGDAHALDTATPLTTLATRALAERDGPGSEREVWERAGIPLDLVSAPVLTWGLPLLGGSCIAVAARAMTSAGLPLHLSAVALRRDPLRVIPGTAVLVVENPRLVEAAAERDLPSGMLCTNGNATTASVLAVEALRRSGAHLRYHGDFDGPGLNMTARMMDLGCVPFRMTAADYRAALDAAAAAGVTLPRDLSGIPDTVWDPGLAAAFTEHRLVVHEERVVDDILQAHAAAAEQ